ncbi:hypothetical protein E4U41_005160 [Claviceps citrina]|nr:hypothetical protein E4U41_005160 [Claviceps citrina]
MSSTAGLGDQGQLNMLHSSYDVASQQFYSEGAMASQLAQQPYRGAFDMAFMGNTLPTMTHHPHPTAHYMHVSGQPYNLPNSPSIAHQRPQVAAFGGQLVPIAAHPYYVTQAQIYPYYHGGHLSHPLNQPSLHCRSNMVVNIRKFPLWHLLMSHPDHAPTSKRNAVRGPPRKPRQSEHALWIGNLPPQTDLMALVQHICKETTRVESLFLISKSNCAFANYKDEIACSTAQQKLHDSKFQTVRLVSRLRRNAVEGTSGTTAPTGPAPAAVSGTSIDQPDAANKGSTKELKSKIADCNETTSPAAQPTQELQARSNMDKFFILKSLTTEDLELSVRTGIWATQSHNEETLSKAFQSVDNVYLIFSANKSGEYFGYARMVSEMNEDPAAAIEFAPKVMMTTEVDLPKAIPIDASEHVPRGKIIDDSARGTIFWEAEPDDREAGSDIGSETTSEQSGATEEEAKTWGKPFELEWLSTTRLPFFRTRGLRNPWNSNREVKIARDGTELEPSVGRRLIGLFNRVQNSAYFGPADRPPLNFVPAYSAMQPFE